MQQRQRQRIRPRPNIHRQLLRTHLIIGVLKAALEFPTINSRSLSGLLGDNGLHFDTCFADPGLFTSSIQHALSTSPSYAKEKTLFKDTSKKDLNNGAWNLAVMAFLSNIPCTLLLLHSNHVLKLLNGAEVQETPLSLHNLKHTHVVDADTENVAKALGICL